MLGNFVGDGTVTFVGIEFYVIISLEQTDR